MADAQSKNIIYCSPYFDPDVPSGANRRFLEICRRFDKEFGSSFELIVAKGKKPSGLTNTVVHEIEYIPKSLASKWKARRQIAAILNSRPPSIFINEFMPIPFKAARRHSHFQVVYDLRYFTENQSLRYRLMYARRLKYEWAHSEFIVTCSEFTKQELIRLCGCDPKNTLISYFGIDGRLLEHSAGSAEPQKDIDVLFVGHFEKRKNHANLLKAIALVDPNLHVELIGVDNGMQAELENLAARLKLSNTHFFTLNDDAKLWDYYKRSKLFVFPSNYEGFGIPLIEALALGTPVACSDMPIFREVGESFVNYFDQNDPKNMTEVISKVLNDPQFPSRADVEAYLNRFLWDTIYRKFVDDLMARSS